MNKIVTPVDEIAWPLERCQGGKLPTIAPLFWYVYISCSGICTFPVLVYVHFLFWHMYISCSGICTFPVLVYVHFPFWYVYISCSGICTFPVLVYVHFLFWYMYISCSGVCTFPVNLWVILSCNSLTLNPLTWKIWWAPNNASKWQMGFDSAFKGLNS